MLGNIIKKRLMLFAFEKLPRISLTCKLVPVQYREYENGLIISDRFIISHDSWCARTPGIFAHDNNRLP